MADDQTTGRGLALCGAFYQQAVRPILERSFPDLPYAAALLGSGSEILGFDDVMSTDHHWGPRLMLFLGHDELARLAEPIHRLLAEELPHEFGGYPTNFTDPDPTDRGVQRLSPVVEGPVNHRVTVQSTEGFFGEYLGWTPDRPLEPADWLTFPEQKLRTISAGAIYHDQIGLGDLRARLHYYPRDIWLYQLAAIWARIGEEEHLMGRAGFVGDELGSALIGSRLVRDLMQLCFLMERTYAPYAKWFGTGFQQLTAAPTLTPPLLGALHAPTWQEREAHLVVAYSAVAAMHNALGLTAPLPTDACSFFGRPFRVIALHGFADALLARISDPAMAPLLGQRLIGGIDLISDNTALRAEPLFRPALRHLYAPKNK